MRTFLKFLALACLLLAIACLVLATPCYRQQYRILKTWPAVEGMVADRAIVPYVDSSGGSLYAAQLEFSYRVNNRSLWLAARSMLPHAVFTAPLMQALRSE